MSLAGVVRRGHVKGQVEVDVLAVGRLVQPGVFQLQRGGAYSERT